MNTLSPRFSKSDIKLSVNKNNTQKTRVYRGLSVVRKIASVVTYIFAMKCLQCRTTIQASRVRIPLRDTIPFFDPTFFCSCFRFFTLLQNKCHILKLVSYTPLTTQSRAESKVSGHPILFPYVGTQLLY